MTGYRIGKTVIHNFLAFSDAEFDFSIPGLTVVEGKIQGVAGCDSNGSGKSALLEAPVWAITGRTIREECSGDKVIRNGVSDGCFVDVSIAGPKSIRIIRYRGHNKHGNKVVLYVDGKDVSRGTSVQTDVAIEEELGLDFDTFLNTVAFGARAEVRSFFFASDAERKKIMDRLLGLQVYERAQAIARAQLREKAAELDPLTTERLSLGFAVDAKLKSIEDLRSLPTHDIVDINDEQLRLRAVRRQIEDIKAQRIAAEHVLSEASSAHRDAMRLHDRAMEQHRKDRDAALREVATKRANAKGHLDAAKQLSDRADRADRLRDANCPTCVQPVSSSTARRLSAALLEEASTAKEAAAKLHKEADVLQQHIDKVSMPVPPSDANVRKAEAAIQSCEQAAKTAKARREQLQTLVDSMQSVYDDVAAKVAKAEEQLRDFQRKLRENEEKQVKIKAEIVDLDFWVTAFGNSGVKSFIIESELPTINETATRYARRLLGDGAFVRLKPTTKLKTQAVEREKMVVEAGIPGCAQSYANASKGQRRRLDLSLILAFRAVVSARSACPFDQLFADELFDGVDATGVDCVIEILKEVSAKCPVVLVTHDSVLSSAGDRRVLVVHDGESASIPHGQRSS